MSLIGVQYRIQWEGIVSSQLSGFLTVILIERSVVSGHRLDGLSPLIADRYFISVGIVGVFAHLDSKRNSVLL